MVRVFAAVLLFAALVLPARAEEVKIKHNGLTLNANLNLAPGKSLADGVILMLHGTMAHKDMEFMRALQDQLVGLGINNLSINLSLSQNDRHGMYDCTSEHRHMNDDALVEIGLWIDWLKAKGANEITLLGHSRSGNQVARYLIGAPDKAVKRSVLVAPGRGGADGYAASGYKRLQKKPLAPVLARAEALIKAGKGDELLKGVGLIYCRDANVAAATFVDYYRFKTERDTTAIITQVKVPTLVVGASNDKVNPFLIEKMKGKDGGNVRMLVIEDAGHFFRDLYGEDLSEAIAEFAGGKSS